MSIKYFFKYSVRLGPQHEKSAKKRKNGNSCFQIVCLIFHFELPHLQLVERWELGLTYIYTYLRNKVLYEPPKHVSWGNSVRLGSAMGAAVRAAVIFLKEIR